MLRYLEVILFINEVVLAPALAEDLGIKDRIPEINTPPVDRDNIGKGALLLLPDALLVPGGDSVENV